MEKKKSKITIDYIAKKAGVAKSTVSRVINNPPGVKPSTKKKVNDLIEELNYTPSILARSLKTNLRRQIALAIDDIRNPYYPEMAWAAEQVAKENGFRVVLINHYGNPSDELAVIKEVNDMHVDGVVLVSISHPKTLSSVIKNSSVPVTLIGSYDDEMPADTVGLTKSEGFLAMDHLIRIGRQRIAYVGGSMKLHRGVRYAAYEKTLSANFMELDEKLVFIGDDLSIQTGMEAASYFTKLENRPDAVFAANDLVAIGVINGLTEKGIRVPEEIAVIGIDDIKWCTLTTPKLSSVSNFVAEMGRIAVKLLLKRIDDSSLEVYGRVKLEPRLIVRESTIKPFRDMSK